eukprot:TRINITY_DN87346_c0_g1_i1.p1 TRINITY_DN87346_c0_g1~~TRINITY_DN87346_c0_g1_i1.p1  ORF type:complete len:660 (-),score=139.70 TRINITY_DN87346_c0_g1_i1:82-2061(-)
MSMSRRAHAKQQEASRRDVSNLEERCELRLGRVIRAAKTRLEADAPAWNKFYSAKQLQSPVGYFEPFAREVVEILYEFLAHRAELPATELQARIEDDKHMYMRESQAYRDRTSCLASPIPRTGTRRKRRDEELYLYEPLLFWDDDQQKVMRQIINSRLRLLLSDPEQRQKLMYQRAGKGKPIHDADKEQDRAEKRATQKRKERARLERELLRQQSLVPPETSAIVVAADADVEEAEEEGDFCIPDEMKAALAAVAAERKQILKDIEKEKDRALKAETERDRLGALRDTREREVEALRKQLQELQDHLAGVKALLSKTGQVPDVDLSQFDTKVHIDADDAVAEIKPTSAPKPKSQEVIKTTKLVKRTPDIDHDALRQLIHEAIGAARRKCDTEKGTLMARIKELQDEIDRIRALLRDPQQQQAVRSRQALTEEKQEKKRRAPREPEKVISCTQRGGTRKIFKRLHADAAQRVTRMICRRMQSDADAAEERDSKYLHPSDGGDFDADSRANGGFVASQLEAAAEQLERFGPEARRKELVRQREKLFASTVSHSQNEAVSTRFAMHDSRHSAYQQWHAAEQAALELQRGRMAPTAAAWVKPSSVYHASTVGTVEATPTLSKAWLPLAPRQAEHGEPVADPEHSCPSQVENASASAWLIVKSF